MTEENAIEDEIEDVTDDEIENGEDDDGNITEDDGRTVTLDNVASRYGIIRLRFQHQIDSDEDYRERELLDAYEEMNDS